MTATSFPPAISGRRSSTVTRWRRRQDAETPGRALCGPKGASPAAVSLGGVARAPRRGRPGAPAAACRSTPKRPRSTGRPRPLDAWSEASVSPNTRRAYAGALRRLATPGSTAGRSTDVTLAAYLAELHDAGRASSSASMAVAAAELFALRRRAGLARLSIPDDLSAAGARRPVAADTGSGGWARKEFRAVAKLAVNVNQMARAVQGAQVGVVVPGSGVLLPEREAGRPSAALRPVESSSCRGGPRRTNAARGGSAASSGWRTTGSAGRAGGELPLMQPLSESDARYRRKGEILSRPLGRSPRSTHGSTTSA